jgi:hypothetical protein
MSEKEADLTRISADTILQESTIRELEAALVETQAIERWSTIPTTRAFHLKVGISGPRQHNCDISKDIAFFLLLFDELSFDSFRRSDSSFSMIMKVGGCHTKVAL